MEFIRRANDEIPIIFEDIINKYNFNIKKTHSGETVIYKDDYGIVFNGDRDYVNIYFLKKEGDKIFSYWIQPFMMDKLTDEDKSNKREGNDNYTTLINYLLIYEKVLQTKRENMLMGKMDWVEDFKKSSMWSIRELYPKEYSRFKDLFM